MLGPEKLIFCFSGTFLKKTNERGRNYFFCQIFSCFLVDSNVKHCVISYTLQRFIVQDNIHAIVATIRNKFAIFYYLRLFSTKPQTKKHSYKKIIKWCGLARFYCTSWETDEYLWPYFDYFQLFFFSKTQVKSIKIKANDRYSNKYVKTQEYYNILLSVLKKAGD